MRQPLRGRTHPQLGTLIVTVSEMETLLRLANIPAILVGKPA
jgi:hypothetical protein